MSRADELREALESELAVVELEDELVALKKAKKVDQARLREVKEQLREARRAYRAVRGGDLAEGDAAAEPDTVNASATVEG